MIAEFKYTLRRMRGQIIGWGIGLVLYSTLMTFFYDSIAQMDNLAEFLRAYPQEMLAFFGDILELHTPKGYLETYYFGYMSVIIGIFAVGAGANLLVNDEERGILDLIMAHPISRIRLLAGRLLGFVAATALILLVSWLGWVIPAGRTQMGLTWIEFLLPFIPLLAMLLLFGTLALLLSLLLPGGRMAGMLTGALLVANYLLLGLANINEELEALVPFTPLYYYQSADAITGLNWGWLLGLLAASALFSWAAWALFQRRDIRVGGERGWQIPSLAAYLAKRRGTGPAAP